jgi:ABC-type branched-subunit amino acid transport system substrate-binding protein
VLEGYDAVKTLEAAVLKAQSTDTLKIRAALQSGVTVHGAAGDFKILPGQHYPFKKMAVVTYKNGKQTLIKFATPKNVPPA